MDEKIQHFSFLIKQLRKKCVTVVCLRVCVTLRRGGVSVLLGAEGGGRLSCGQRAVVISQLHAAVALCEPFSWRHVSIDRRLRTEAE